MVYRDISAPESKSSTSVHPFKYKASLMDRFFSFVIDYLIFSPFISFTLFILFHDAIRYWRINPDAAEQIPITILLGLSYILIFSLYQALFICFWRATPGQYFLKIQIVFDAPQDFIFWRAFCRQCGFWTSILLLGAPWLALLSHPLQKTFYDRMTECRVLSKKNNSIYFTFEAEARFWQSFTATMMIFVGLIFFSLMLIKYNDITQRTESFKIYEKKNFFCSELKGVNQSSRLQLAIAMNLVGQLSDDCLDHEADFVLWKSKTEDLELAYYAKSLTEENSEAETKYLKKACAQPNDNLGCHISKAFQSADFEKLYTFLKVQNSLLARTLTYELGLILKKDDEQESNFSQLAEFDDQRLIKKYLLSEIIAQRKIRANREPASRSERNENDNQDKHDEQAYQLIKDL